MDAVRISTGEPGRELAGDAAGVAKVGVEEEADVGPAVVVAVFGSGVAAGAARGTLLEDDGDGLGGSSGSAVRAVRDGLVVTLERGRGGRVAERDGVRRDGKRDLDKGAAVVEEDGARRRGAEPQRKAAVLGRAGVRDRRERGAERGAQCNSMHDAGHLSGFLFLFLGVLRGDVPKRRKWVRA